MSSVNSLTVEQNGCKVTIQRRTVLSDARHSALLLQLAPHLETISKQVKEQSDVVDIALTRYIRLVSQITDAENVPIPLVAIGDDSKTTIACCVAYLLELDPDIMRAWTDGAATVDASWNAPELQPTPPEHLPKNS